jgi:hypothetical protein
LFALLGGLAMTGLLIYAGWIRASAVLPVSVVTLHV